MFGGRSNALKGLIKETGSGAQAPENSFGRVLASLTGSSSSSSDGAAPPSASASAYASPSASATAFSSATARAYSSALPTMHGARQVESKQRRSREWEHSATDGQQKMAARLHALRELALVCQSQVLERSTIVEAWVSCIDLLEHEVRVCRWLG